MLNSHAQLYEHKQLEGIGVPEKLSAAVAYQYRMIRKVFHIDHLFYNESQKHMQPYEHMPSVKRRLAFHCIDISVYISELRSIPASLDSAAASFFDFFEFFDEDVPSSSKSSSSRSLCK